MYVVGAGKLRSFSEKRAEAAGPLAAIYAVLSETEWATPEAMALGLGEIAEALPDGAIAVNLDWCGARLLLRCNYAAGVVLIERVTRSE